MPGPEACFTESIVVHAARLQVLAQLTEPTKMIGLQPLIVGCELVDQELAADGGIRSYEAIFTEHFQLVGPLGYKNRVRARMQADRAVPAVAFTVRSFPRIRLGSRYELAAAPSATLVRLTVTIDCPRVLRPLVVSAARAAHRRLLGNLKRRCEEVVPTAQGRAL
jgi:hypothetical protein